MAGVRTTTPNVFTKVIGLYDKAYVSFPDKSVLSSYQRIIFSIQFFFFVLKAILHGISCVSVCKLSQGSTNGLVIKTQGTKILDMFQVFVLDNM